MLDKINTIIIQPAINDILASEAAMFLLVVYIAFDLIYAAALCMASMMERADSFRKAWKTIRLIPISAVTGITAVCLYSDPFAVINLLLTMTTVTTLGCALFIGVVNSVIGLGNAISK